MFQRATTPRLTPRRALAFGVIGALTFAACGSDDAADDDASTTQPPSTEAPADDEAMEDEPVTTDAMEDEDAADDEAADDEAMDDGAMEDDEAMDDGAMEDEEAGPQLTLDVAGLPVLGAASVYEGWVIVDDAPVTTGRFLVDEAGALVGEDGSAIDHFAVDATGASAFVLTIEPVVDDDPAPSDVHLLGGDVVDGAAVLTIDHPTAIGTDFADAAGSVEVVAPTAERGPDTDTAGIWFFKDGAGSLTLPVLPAGWVYEGWAVFDGIPVTTGRFTDPNMADDFDGFSGDGDGPATPGEDFIRNAPEGLEFPRSAAGATVVVSVEPAEDDSPAPFVLKPLTTDLPPEVQRLDEFPLVNTGTETFPTGTVTITPAT